MKTRAPGKLFIVGEYAVLEDAPAVLTPVPVHATASFVEDGRGSITTLTETTETVPLTDYLRNPSLVSSIVDELDLLSLLEKGSLVLDSSEFFDNGIKLGFGSSAAVTAAMISLFRPELDTQSKFQLAQSSHRRFQEGVGSGADIALSLANEIIVFQKPDRIEPLLLPRGLKILAIWTGHAASTKDYLHGLSDWRRKNPGAYESHIGQLSDIARSFLQAASSGAVTDCLDAIHRYGEALKQLSTASSLHFYDHSHVALQKKVELSGCIYKPSGAGGGDFGIACGTDDDIARASSLLAEGSYKFLEL